MKRSEKKVIAIKQRVPIASLTDSALLKLLPQISMSIQECVDTIIGEWNNSEVVQTRFPRRAESYVHMASICVRIPVTAALLCAAAYFSDMSYRLSKRGSLFSNAATIRALCLEFIREHKSSKTNEGDYLDDTVKTSRKPSVIADHLNKRIRYRDYSEQMVNAVLTLVGTPRSPQRKLLEQIWRIHKIEKPKRDEVLASLQKKYGRHKEKILQLFKLQIASNPRDDRKRVVHARNSSTWLVFGSPAKLAEQMKRLGVRKKVQEGSGNRAMLNEVEEVIPF